MKIMKKKLFFIVIVIVISISASLLIPKTLENQQDREDNIEFITQQVDILETSSIYGNPSIKKVGEEGVYFYKNEISKFCRFKYIYKNNCKLEEIGLKELKLLKLDLEKYIQKVKQLQEEERS